MIALSILADAGSVTDSTYTAPGAMLLAALGLLAAAAKFYKEARNIDVEGERNRRVAAEAREKESGESTAAKVDELKKRIDSLERTIEQLRAEQEERLLAERGKNFKLRVLLRDNGIEIPEELGP